MNKFLDHTNLKATATSSDIKKLCEEALEYDFASVCVNSCYVSLAKELLKNSHVEICTVVGFPLGAMESKSKAFEAKISVENGASEIDMVINIGAAKEGNWELVQKDIAEVVKATKEAGKINGCQALVKVIIETCYLSDEEIVKACEISKLANADFVKTSTGFGTAGATIEHVKLMKKTVGDSMKIKAAGGIRNKETAKAMIAAGANRLGTSNGCEIMK